ncbi:20181_t:CDS:10, partial [Entrophospora sp. SA101]
CLKVKDKSSRFSKGILERPFYLALIEMLTNCFGNGGKFPDNVKKSKVFMLENINLTRLEDIENEMKKLIDLWNGFPIIFQNSHKSMIKEFLFGFLNFEDLNTFLGLKTTFKSSSHLPPSFNECVESFTRVYIKKNQKKNPRNPNSSNILTIGGKALSKHSHRDKSTLFWGVCTGTESKKNEQANHVLAKIITNASWVNLHSLPHDILVYEIRNDLGYGQKLCFVEACGFEYTSKLQRMFTDMGLSKDLNDQFRERHSVEQVDNQGCSIYSGVERTFQRFKIFYQNKHSGRKLNWLFHLSKGELKANYLKATKTGYTFQVSTYQMGILLQYNKDTSYSFEELSQSTDLSTD